MISFIKHCFFFLLTTIGIYLAIFAILFFINVGGIPLVYRATQGNVWKGGGTYIKTHQFNKDEKHDIIVVGSSHAYRGYDPRIFKEYGFNTYNLGTSDQKVLCSYYLIKNFINKDNCDVVLFDLYDRVFSQSNIESYSDMVQNIPSDKAALEISIASKDLRAINMFTLRQFNKVANPLDPDTVGYINGYLPTEKLLKLPAKRREFIYQTNDESLYYLEKIIQYLQSEGVKIVLTEHALPSVVYVKQHELFRNDVLPILKKYNVQWFDYTTDSTMNGIQYFADESHLNVTGVYKYNHRLIKDLIKSNVLKSATNDSSFVYKQ